MQRIQLHCAGLQSLGLSVLFAEFDDQVLLRLPMLFMRGRAHGKEFTHCWRCLDVLVGRPTTAQATGNRDSHEMHQ
jgi:hypothetical protein